MVCAITSVLAFAGPGAGANLPPRAELLVVDVSPGSPVSFKLAATDPDGDPLTFAILGGPRHGRLEGTAPRLTYTPDRGFLGEDELTFAVTDPHGAFDLGMVRLRVTPGITTHRIGNPERQAAPDAGLASLASHLVGQQVRTWYIFTQPSGPFAIGQEIPVLLPPGGEVHWVGLSQIGADDTSLVPITRDWNPMGWLRVTTPTASPGTYILTVVKDQQAFSFLFVLKSAPGQGTHLATASPGERQGG